MSKDTTPLLTDVLGVTIDQAYGKSHVDSTPNQTPGPGLPQVAPRGQALV